MAIECNACNAIVIPKKDIAIGWVVFWVIVFWPAAIIYAITRQPVQCPSCGGKVYGNSAPSDLQDINLIPQQETHSKATENSGSGKVKHRPALQTKAAKTKTRSFSRREFKVAIVGESHYLRTLRRAKDSVKDYNGTGYINVILAREPANKFDENAIKVMTTDLETIGYLSRAKAKRYQKAFDVWANEGYLIKCQAKLVGGTKEKKNIGAWLDLETPKTIESAFQNRRAPK